MKEKIFYIFIFIFLGLSFAESMFLFEDQPTSEIVTNSNVITGEVITIIKYDCGGCLSGDNCYMIGARSGEKYCSESKDILMQKYPENFLPKACFYCFHFP